MENNNRPLIGEFDEDFKQKRDPVARVSAIFSVIIAVLLLSAGLALVVKLWKLVLA